MPITQQEIASLIVAGFTGTALPRHFADTIKDYGIGGVILFARNYESREQLQGLTSSIKNLASECLIAVDQEGGRVVRFERDFPTFPSPSYYARRGDFEGLLQATAVTAEHLRRAGVDLNLIPVCDLAASDSGHVISSRAISDNPHQVGEIAARQVEILHFCGLLACAKHFPGLASAVGDPHQQVAKSLQSAEQFRQHDYLPFLRVIEAGVDFVMTTHLLAPALDPDEIATFSSRIVSEELRERLAFRGVVISDDLQMQGALNNGDEIHAGVRALRAGCNLLLYADLTDSLRTLVDSIYRQAETDPVLADAIRNSLERRGQLNIRRGKITSS